MQLLVVLAAFCGVTCAVWALIYFLAPMGFRGGRSLLSRAGGAILRIPLVKRQLERRAAFLGRTRAYAPAVVVIVVGFALVVFGGDQFIDLAEALHRSTPKMQHADRAVHDWAIAHRENGATEFFIAATMIGSPPGLGVILLAVTVVLAIRRRFRWIAYLFVTTAGGAVLNLVLKDHFMRARPDLALALRSASGYSFPSGHSMGSTVVFAALSYVAWRGIQRWSRKSLAFALAITMTASICFSRVYIGVHWISDIAAGISAGLVWVAITTVAYEVVRRVRLVRSARIGTTT